MKITNNNENLYSELNILNKNNEFFEIKKYLEKNILLNKYIKKIDEYDSSFLNDDQKYVILKWIKYSYESNKITNYEMDEFFKFLTQRVKTGFTFDEIPKIFNGYITIPIETKKGKTKSFKGSENKDNLEHLLFIGENYDILKNLLIVYKNKIDIIYIDPPYNTEAAKTEGNFLSKEQEEKHTGKFIYNDKFSRAGWLNMIKQRLELSFDLLSEDGVIFISIDNREQAYLKVLMDGIFGEENFVSNICWLKGNAQNDAHNFQSNYEFILCYSKKNKINLIKKEIKEINKSKPKSVSLILGGTTKEALLIGRPNMGQTVYWNKNTNEKLVKIDYDPNNIKLIETDDENKVYKNDLNLINEGFIPIRPPRIGNEEKLGRWTWNAKKMEENLDKLKIISTKNNKFTIHRIDDRELSILPHKNFINISSSNGSRIYNQIMNIAFPNPKPVELIEHLIGIVNISNPTILDFFAGTGTTGQAVLSLNKKDGGKRKFILATNNENDIAENITYERLYRIIKGEGSNGEKNFIWIGNHSPYIKNNLKIFNLEKLYVGPEQKLDTLKANIIQEYKKINDKFTLLNENDIFYKLSSLTQSIDKK